MQTLIQIMAVIGVIATLVPPLSNLLIFVLRYWGYEKWAVFFEGFTPLALRLMGAALKLPSKNVDVVAVPSTAIVPVAPSEKNEDITQ